MTFEKTSNLLPNSFQNSFPFSAFPGTSLISRFCISCNFLFFFSPRFFPIFWCFPPVFPVFSLFSHFSLKNDVSCIVLFPFSRRKLASNSVSFPISRQKLASNSISFPISCQKLALNRLVFKKLVSPTPTLQYDGRGFRSAGCRLPAGQGATVLR